MASLKRFNYIKEYKVPETTRLNSLETKINSISLDQAVIKNELGGISEAIVALVDIRAESLHLMKAQEENHEQHTEMFTRMRILEKETASCTSDRVGIKKDVTDLKKNQRWGVLAVIGVVIAGVSPLIKSAFATICNLGN